LDTDQRKSEARKREEKLTDPAKKRSGFVATPAPIARELVRWAVGHANDKVLDLGAGEGVFLIEVAQQLRDLGATANDLAAGVLAVEKDPARYVQALSALRTRFDSDFPGIHQGNLFECEFPPISALVGNPPYVRRASLDDVDAIHNRILHNDLLLGTIPRLVDLYAYFLVYAERFLVPGGRLAVVVSSSWLDTRSGAFLKQFLLTRFRLHAIVACETRLFQDALVKSVLLLAEKGVPTDADTLKFVRLREFRSGILSEIDEAVEQVSGAQFQAVPQTTLREDVPWSIYLRTPGPYFHVRAKTGTLLGKLVESRIGIQPLARDFFILSAHSSQAEGLSAHHLQPIAYSPRHVNSAVLSDAESVPHRILCTRDGRDAMDTALRAYVERAERVEVPIRGKGRSVTGYHNVPRLRQAGREPWYNLADEIDRRGRYTILLPRRFYETFVVVWNRAGVIAGENFIELRPNRPDDTLPLLAILNSSFFELVARCHAQQYGGGVFNLNPVDVKLLPTFALPKDAESRTRLAKAFEEFAKEADQDTARRILDRAVGDTFRFQDEEIDELWRAVLELRALGSAANRIHVGLSE
jgi:methylase of polypeptide subunit release factors